MTRLTPAATAGDHLTDGGRLVPAFQVARDLTILERGRRAAEQHARLGTATGRLMWLFRDGEPRTLRDVAGSLGLEQSTVNRQVNAALKDGLLERSREPGQSAHLLSATPAGLEAFEHDLRWHLGLHEAALSVIPADERDRFAEQLTAFVDAYEAAAAEH